MRSLFSLPVGAERSTKANQAHHSKVLMERRRGKREGGGANGGEEEDKSTRGSFVGTRMEEGRDQVCSAPIFACTTEEEEEESKNQCCTTTYSAELISMAKRLSPNTRRPSM